MGSYPWFMPFRLAFDKAANYSSYHAGTYLQNMVTILVLMQYFMISPMLFLFIKSFKQGCANWYYFGVFLIITVVIYLRQKRIKRRRELLENELLSIHSCGVVWQAVTLAHVLARKNCIGFCEHYTELLVEQCHDIKENVYAIHDWFKLHMGVSTSCPLSGGNPP